MEIQTKVSKDNIILNLSGDIDLYNSSVLENIITSRINQNNINFIIDLSEVDNMDTHALEVLRKCFKRVKQYQGEFKIVNHSDFSNYNLNILH